jgi:Ca2+-binding EF-hand superfamily protein
MGAMLQQVGMMADQNPDLFNAIKQVRAAIAEGESDIRTQLMLKAAEWTAGGVDEVTFISQVTPMLRAQLEQPIDQAKITQSLDQVQQAITMMSGVQWPALQNMTSGPQAEMAQSFQNNPEIMAINQKVQEDISKVAASYAPELCRNLFRFLDLDKSGRITTRELNVLKAVMDGFLRIGTSTLKDTGCLNDADKADLSKMYPDLFKEGIEHPTMAQEISSLLMAIFDVVDRNGDGSLQPEEVVSFLQSFLAYFLAQMKVMAKVYIECFVSMEKEMLKLLWSKLSIAGNVTKEQVPQVGMSLMMLVMSSMPQPAGQ